jgi:hypothetical protein
MATYDYRNRATGEIQEIIYLPGEVAPQQFERDGEMWERQFPSPRIVTADTRGFREVPNEKELRRRGSHVREPGVDKDVLKNKELQKRAQADALEESVVATVNRAMP